MSPTLTRLLIRLYPRPWRDRYAAEFTALLETWPTTPRTAINIAFSALHERIAPTQGAPMTTPPITFGAITRKPSAYLPIVLSLIALTVVLTAVALNGGVVHEADEGAAAHIWQILMVLQLPILLVFAIKWLRRSPRRAAQVLALQAAALAANVAAVFFLT
jgi:hypothetical protein